jgi:hemoglobin
MERERFPEDEILERIGEDGVARLVAAFYAQIPGDPILGPMYPPEDMAGAEERLREFLIFRFGGPPRYIEQRGHPRLRMRHAPYRIGPAARDRWLHLMENAIGETVADGRAAELLRGFLGGMAAFLQNAPS